MNNPNPVDSYKQHIPLEGTPNFRDLGGRTNSRGMRLKRGRIFRSGFLTELSAEDWETLRKNNLSYICDFRRSDEIEKMPTNPPYHIDILHCPVGDGSHNHLIREAFLADDISEEKVAGFMIKVNRDFVFKHHEAFAQLFQQLLKTKSDEALLFHCTAGKDRTGFAAALILFSLGFSREQVLEDYLLTTSFFEPEIEMERVVKAIPEEQILDIDVQLIKPILEVRPEFIESALQTLESRIPIDDYLREYMKLGKSELERLQEIYMEA